MTDDRGRYLTSMDGLTHEVFGGDPEEIVLRVASVGEGAATLGDLARSVRAEADRYERLERDGWRLSAPFRDGEARCRKAAETDDTPVEVSASPPPGAPERLAAVVDGAGRLPDVAARLRAAADAYERLAADDRKLTDPVAGGHVPLD